MTAASAGGQSEASTVARWLAVALVGVLAAVFVLGAFAPASFADLALERATAGRVRLADSAGSLWQGEGRLMLPDLVSAQGDRPGTGMVVPGRLRWRVQPLPLLLGIVDAVLEVDGMSAPVRVNGDLSEWHVGAGSLALPEIDLASLGSPWNTIRPVAAVSMRWDPLTIRANSVDGKASIELRDAASAMTQVRPLGTYRIDLAGAGHELSLALVTLAGDLRLEGKGRWEPRAGVSFTAYAWGDGPVRAQLQNLLGLIGGLEGDRTVIRIGG